MEVVNQSVWRSWLCVIGITKTHFNYTDVIACVYSNSQNGRVNIVALSRLGWLFLNLLVELEESDAMQCVGCEKCMLGRHAITINFNQGKLRIEKMKKSIEHSSNHTNNRDSAPVYEILSPQRGIIAHRSRTG